MNNKPPELPSFSPFRLDPFSFGFQVKAGYTVPNPITVEVYNGSTLIIPAAEIGVAIQDNFVTVSFTADQIADLPVLSQCYISWGGARRVMTNLTPGLGGGTPDLNKIVVDIIEVQIVGDTANSILAADRSEAAQVISEQGAATSTTKANEATTSAASALASKNTAATQAGISTTQAGISTDASIV